jgi:effector-binding domain-containing protein
VRIERTAPRPLAAIRATSSRAQLSKDIIRLLDQVWPVLREQGVPTGHNVVIYHGGPKMIDVGVEAFGEFAETRDLRHTATPSGEAVTTTHWGDYSKMQPAYAALERWWQENHRRPAGISWEVYGDWHDDPSEVRTDIYFLLEPTLGS